MIMNSIGGVGASALPVVEDSTEQEAPAAAPVAAPAPAPKAGAALPARRPDPAAMFAPPPESPLEHAEHVVGRYTQAQALRMEDAFKKALAGWEKDHPRPSDPSQLQAWAAARGAVHAKAGAEFDKTEPPMPQDVKDALALIQNRPHPI